MDASFLRIVAAALLFVSLAGVPLLYEHYTPLLLSCVLGAVGAVGLLRLRRWGAVVVCLAAWSLLPMLFLWAAGLSLSDNSAYANVRIDIGFIASFIGAVLLTGLVVVGQRELNKQP